MQQLALLRPLIHPALLPAASPLAARCRRGRGRGVRWRCATGGDAGGEGEEGSAAAASWLSSELGEKVDELMRREENRALLEGVEAAERRVERARAALADIERQEAAARLASEEVRRLERRRDEIAESQRELLQAREMIDEAQRSLSSSLEDQSFRDVLSGDIDEDSERLESVKAAAVSSVVGVLASLPISFYEVHDLPQLFVHLSVIFISCALFGVTFRYAIRRDLDNVQLKTGAAAAFAFVRGLAMVESGMPFELSTDALISLTLDGTVSVVENILTFLPAAIALDFCFKMRLLSPFPTRKHIILVLHNAPSWMELNGISLYHKYGSAGSIILLIPTGLLVLTGALVLARTTTRVFVPKLADRIFQECSMILSKVCLSTLVKEFTSIGSGEMALKVFNWLNRKKHSNVEYCTINENKAMEEKEDSLRASVTEQDTEALLFRDVLINGILAIGTLGHNVNSLCPEPCIEQDVPIIMCDEKVEEEKCEMEKTEAKEDVSVTASSELASALEPAKMHSSSMKEDNLTCFVMEEIPMHSIEVEDVPNIQERPLLMLEKVEKVRTTLADLFAAEAFSSSDTEEKCCQKIIIVSGASTSKPTSCMEKMHHNKPTKPTSKPLKATRKLSRVMRKVLGKKIHPEQLNGRSNTEGPGPVTA
uniref:Uncharacterized protein n=1 Tax=Leersia perrieri TaxID=77586 RepID=A0A0D9XFX5_9ORYZ